MRGLTAHLMRVLRHLVRVVRAEDPGCQAGAASEDRFGYQNYKVYLTELFLILCLGQS